MTRTGIAILLLLSFAIGCSSSKPAPKPFTWESSTSSADAQKKVQQAQAQDPCSQENLKNATPEQKHKCDPTTGMFDNVRPATPPPVTNPPKTKNQRGAKQGS